MAYEAELLDAIKRGNFVTGIGQSGALKEVFYAGSCLQPRAPDSG